MEKSAKEKDRKFLQFLKTPLIVDANVVRGVGGAVSVQPKNKGKKPGQRKRKVAARTTTPAK